MTDDRNLCSLCIQEGELRDWLERSGSEGDCDFDPGHTSVTCVSVDEFAEEADRWFQQHYQPGGPTIEIDPDPESAGHGTMIDNQFYLVPYGADSSSMEHLKADAIPATEFRSEIEKLAQHGRVLVLLDACRSAGLISGPSNALPPAEVLRAVMNTGNVTVLTSSTADKVSHEDEKWGHGAFTKAVLDALSASDDVDTNHDGVISMSELTAYVGKHLTELTDGDQQLGLDQRFQGDIFVAGL